MHHATNSLFAVDGARQWIHSGEPKMYLPVKFLPGEFLCMTSPVFVQSWRQYWWKCGSSSVCMVSICFNKGLSSMGVLPENVKLQCSSAAAEGGIRGNVNDDFVVYVLPCNYLYQYLEVILFRRCHGCDATVKALLLCYTGCGTYCSPARRVHNRLCYGMKSKTKWQGRRGQCRCKFITLATKSPDQHWWDSDLTLSRQINVSLTMTQKSLFSDNQVGCHAN